MNNCFENLKIVVAVGNENQIGLDNKLLWNVKSDLKNFKELTTGKTVIMGRKTYESIGRALPNRENIVLTRDSNLKIEGVRIENDFEPLLQEVQNSPDKEFMVIGGSEIYSLFLPYVSKLYISLIDYSGPADAYFPKLEESDWSAEIVEERDGYMFSVINRSLKVFW